MHNSKLNLKSAFAGLLTGFCLWAFFIVLAKPSLFSVAKKSPQKDPESVLFAGVTTKKEVPEKNSEGDNGKNPNFEETLALIPQKKGVYGLYIKDLTLEKEFSINPTGNFYGASLYKILVGGAVYELISQGKLSLNYEYIYTADDVTDGTGSIKNQAIGTKYSVDELLNYLFRDSDNIAQNILTRNIGEKEIFDFYEKYTNSQASPRKFYPTGETSPKEVSEIFINLFNNETWPKTLRKDFFNRLSATSFDDRISLGLESSRIFAHKIGTFSNGIFHDCGIVFDSKYSYPIVVCLMSKQADLNEFLEVAKSTGSFVNSLFPSE